MKKFYFAVAALCFAAVSAAEISVDPKQSVIETAPGCGAVAQFAAKDLQKHLKMITGVEIPVVKKAESGKYVFRFIKEKGLKSEEARWSVTEKAATFSGDDDEVKAPYVPAQTKQRTGSISAVADFLERQLKVRWMEPGDDGVYFIPSKTLKLQTGSNSWNPGRLVSREIRPDYARYNYKGAKLNSGNMPDSLQYDRKSYEKKTEANILWLKHHRMGGSTRIPFGHSFTRWWKIYGKTHPEYFALVNGKRQPKGDPDRIKMCVSNPALWKQIVDNWKNQKVRGKYINICENDSGNYCECAECRKLDVPKEGKKWNEFLSDRYFYFANQVLREARKVDPEVQVCFYAYSCYKEPPAKVKLDKGVIIGFVPSMMSLESAEEMYKGWRKVGADWIFLRPNDHHVNTGMPMGLEEQMWKGFQLGVKNGIVGTDYDTCHGFWPATGLSDYILTRAHCYPEASFEELFNHYCEGYGNMAQEIKEYFTYWRKNVWEKRLVPNRGEIAKRGRYGNFRRGLMWDLPKYFNEKDFEITGKILDKAEAKAQTPVEKKRIAWLKLGHQHEQLTFQALCAKPKEKIAQGKKLLQFRLVNREKLNVNLLRETTIELEFGDITGIGKAYKFGAFKGFEMLPLQWQFKIDPKNEGEKAGWEKLSWKTIGKEWSPIYVDSNWETQRRKNVPEELKKQLSKYDGYGWYAKSFKVPKAWKGQKIYLLFGAVDESAKVWLNGKLCGVREYKNSDDWKTPFTMEITEQIDWKKGSQLVVVQVFDGSGAGGIWQPVSVVTK